MPKQKIIKQLDKNIGEKIITLKMGEEVEKALRGLMGKEFECLCGNKIIIRDFLGYPKHPSGYADKDGEKWWIYVNCDKCNYDWSLWKIVNRIK